MNLRKLAKGKDCLVRLPGCSHDPEQTVLAHIRRANVAGMGQKPNDLIAVWACWNCHEIIDSRAHLPGLSKPELDTYILDALCRTLAEVGKEL